MYAKLQGEMCVQGLIQNSLMRLHSGRLDCILGGCGAFWAGAFFEFIYILINPRESKEIYSDPLKCIEIHINFRV